MAASKPRLLVTRRVPDNVTARIEAAASLSRSEADVVYGVVAGWQGATTPLDAMDIVDEVDDVARKIGAISCVVVKQHVIVDTVAGLFLGSAVFFGNEWLGQFLF